MIVSISVMAYAGTVMALAGHAHCTKPWPNKKFSKNFAKIKQKHLVIKN